MKINFVIPRWRKRKLQRSSVFILLVAVTLLTVYESVSAFRNRLFDLLEQCSCLGITDGSASPDRWACDET